MTLRIDLAELMRNGFICASTECDDEFYLDDKRRRESEDILVFFVLYKLVMVAPFNETEKEEDSEGEIKC